MSQGNEDQRFSELQSYSLGADVLVAPDTSRVVLATPNGRLEIVESDGASTSVSVDGRIEGLAADQYVFTLSAGEVTAYTTSGIDLWTTTVDSASDICAYGDHGVLACITDDGRITSLDTETGATLHEVERPHGDISERNAIAGGNGRIAVAAWSFLTVFDDTGEVVLDSNLEGAIKDVALLATAAVVQMKNGQLKRLEIPSGSESWTRAIDGRTVTPFESDAILTIDDEIQRIDSHGNVDPLALPGGEGVVASTNGQLLCRIDEGTQTTYTRGQSSDDVLEATLISTELREGELLRFRVTNEGPKAIDTPVDVTAMPAEGIRFDRVKDALTLSPGETSEVAVRVLEVATEQTVSVELSADGTPIEEATVSLEARTDPTDKLDISADVERVTGSDCEVSIAVANNAETVSEARFDDETIGIEPGDTETLSVTMGVDAEPERSVSVSLNGNTTAIPVTVPVPAATPSLSITAAQSPTNPYLDVSLTNPFDVPFADTLSIAESEGQVSLDRSLDVAPGTTIRVAIPLTREYLRDGLEVIAALSGQEISERTTLAPEDWQALSAESPGPQREQPSLAQPDTTPSTPTGAGQTDAPVSVDRQVPTTVREYERFDETLTVENETDDKIENIDLFIGEASYRIDLLAPRESVTVARLHAVTESGQLELDAGSLECNDTSYPIPPETVTVTSAAMATRVRAEPAGPEALRILFECENQGTDACSIETVGIDPRASEAAVWPLDAKPLLQPDESIRLDQRAEFPGGNPSEPFTAGVQYRQRDGEKTKLTTLVALDTADSDATTTDTDDGEAAGDAGPFSLHTDLLSPEAGAQNVVIKCVVTANTELSNVKFEASGDVLNDIYTGVRDIGEMDRGAEEDETVYLTPEETGPTSFEVRIAAETADGTVETSYTLTGEVVDDGESAVQSAGGWSVEGDDGAGDQRTSSDSAETARSSADDRTTTSRTHLVTSFRE